MGKITDDKYGAAAGLISSDHILDIWSPDLDAKDGVTKVYLDQASGSSVYVPLDYIKFIQLLEHHGYSVYTPSDIDKIRERKPDREGGPK